MIIDSDRHVAEPLDLWEKYLPEHLVIHAPYLVTKMCAQDDVEPDSLDSSVGIEKSLGLNQRLGTNAGDFSQSGSESSVSLGGNKAVGKPVRKPETELQLHGQPLFYKLSRTTQADALKENESAGNPSRLAESPETQLKAMDDSGITIAMLYPSIAMYIVYNNRLEENLSCAFATAYNNWLNDYCQYEPDRLKGVGLISRHAPELMKKELDRVLAFGWKTVVLRPEPIMGRTLGHADYEDFWEACESSNVSVAFHGGTHLHAPTAGSDRFDTRFAMHACSHPFEAQMAFLSLLESGVLERHPQLKIAFLEAGASWVPHWLWRLDEICYRSTATEIKNKICRKPSEYFKRQCWVGFESGEPCLREVVDAIGIDKLLYGTDFPHPDHLHFHIDDLQSEHSPFNSDELKLILGDNPATFFNLG